jgi:hypothetical protein
MCYRLGSAQSTQYFFPSLSARILATADAGTIYAVAAREPAGTEAAESQHGAGRDEYRQRAPGCARWLAPRYLDGTARDGTPGEALLPHHCGWYGYGCGA